MITSNIAFRPFGSNNNKVISRLLAATGVLVCFLQSQSAYAITCYTDTPETTPTIFFTDNNNGTVTDGRTELMWSTCSEGQTWSAGTCTGTHSEHNWSEALDIPTTQNAALYLGYSDWRLPNKTELASILEMSCVNPAINIAVFPNTPNTNYWTSTPSTNPNNPWSWRVVFLYGNITLKPRTDSYAIRLVRDE